MAWFKVDDGFSSSPKVLSIRRRDRLAAVGLWTVAGAWAAKHLTDGFIPAYMLEELAAEESQVDNLVTAGLWREEGDGYQFHDWHDYQPTRVDVLANRERERQRKEAYRAKKAGNAGESPSGTPPDGDAGQERVSGHPDPTRPDPTRPSISNEIDDSLSPDESDNHGILIPAEWRPNQKHIDKARSLRVDVKNEYQRFRSHAERTQRRMKNWNAGFTNWLKQGVVMERQQQGAPIARIVSKAEQRQQSNLSVVAQLAALDEPEQREIES